MLIVRSYKLLGFIGLVLVLGGFLPALLPAASAAPVIGLFTDCEPDDPYPAQLKGVMLTVNPDAQILDLVRSPGASSVGEAGYLLDQSAMEFPAGTIFIAVLDSQAGTDHEQILVETAKHKFYLGPNTGILAEVISREGFARAWRLDKPEVFHTTAAGVSRAFRGREILAPLAAELAAGGNPDRMGVPVTEKDLDLPVPREPSLAGGTISAEVLHLDRLGNVIVNLHEGSDIAAKLKEGNLVRISIGRQTYSGPLVKSLGDVAKGRLLLLYGDRGLLEIAMNQGSAEKELKVQSGTIIFLKP